MYNFQTSKQKNNSKENEITPGKGKKLIYIKIGNQPGISE